MERYSSFKKLKERTNLSSTNNFISSRTENQIIGLIEILRASIISSNIKIAKQPISNSKTNSTPNGR